MNTYFQVGHDYLLLSNPYLLESYVSSLAGAA